MTLFDLKFDYYLDPLCGWCYASAPALAGLAEKYPDQMAMRPSGLFFDPRPVASIADHAERNDRHIQKITGQRFTEAYHQGVMRSKGGVFGSNFLTRAMVALGQYEAALEPNFLHDAQIARYVQGKDTSRAREVALVACRTAAKAAIELNVAEFEDKLTNCAELERETQARISDTQARQASLPGGVPLLVVTLDGRPTPLSGEKLYRGAAALFEALDDLLKTTAGRELN